MVIFLFPTMNAGQSDTRETVCSRTNRLLLAFGENDLGIYVVNNVVDAMREISDEIGL